jgi:predicted dehydrogenase
MLRVGIVGAESNHSESFSVAINVEKRVRGVRVTHIWGETASQARTRAAVGEIPHIVKRPEDMIGEIDGVVIAPCHPKNHLPLARPLLEAKVPLFIDKALCYRVSEGKRFLARAARLKVPVGVGSVVPLQPAFLVLQKEVRKLGDIRMVVSTGPSDIKSKHGGLYFYAIHQVESVLRLLGYDVGHAQVFKGAQGNHVAVLAYRDGKVATMNLVRDAAASFFHMSVIGEKGRLDHTTQAMPYHDTMYLPGIRYFVKLFRTGRSVETAQTMLAPVGVLQALEKSIAGGGRVKVSF